MSKIPLSMRSLRLAAKSERDKSRGAEPAEEGHEEGPLLIGLR